MDALEPIREKLIKVVYVDSGEVKIRKGRLIAFDSSFITVRTFDRTYAIQRGQIIEVKTLEGKL